MWWVTSQFEADIWTPLTCVVRGRVAVVVVVVVVGGRVADITVEGESVWEGTCVCVSGGGIIFVVVVVGGGVADITVEGESIWEGTCVCVSGGGVADVAGRSAVGEQPVRREAAYNNL